VSMFNPWRQYTPPVRGPVEEERKVHGNSGPKGPRTVSPIAFLNPQAKEKEEDYRGPKKGVDKNAAINP